MITSDEQHNLFQWHFFYLTKKEVKITKDTYGGNPKYPMIQMLVDPPSAEEPEVSWWLYKCPTDGPVTRSSQMPNAKSQGDP